jgi:uncharacterized damage-inducible protein DinB
MDDQALLRELSEAAARTLRQNLGQIRRCVRLLSESQAWARANAHCNSVANLMLHLTGNVRQWIVSGLDGDPFERDRPAEFAARGPRPVAPILEELERVVERAIGVIQSLRPDSLLEARTIQGYSPTVLTAIVHVVEHFSFHTGQVIHMTKAIRDVDLSLYDAQGQRIDASRERPW